MAFLCRHISRHVNPLGALLLTYGKVVQQGGRVKNRLRYCSFWSLVRQYFPAKVVHTAPLDPKKTYIFGLHPHGVMAVSHFVNVVSNPNAFPKIDVRYMTVTNNFYIPFWRDFILFMGFIDAKTTSCDYLLSRGTSLGIVVGGAAEALDARPNTNDLVLYSRLGFIKLAIRHGASLVPVFAFGENDLYDQILPNRRGGWIRQIQDYIKEKLTFSTPLFKGQYFIIPLKKPLVTVVGAPIQVQQHPNPPDELVRKVQQQYLQALEQLYHQHKEQYAPNRTKEICFIDQPLQSQL